MSNKPYRSNISKFDYYAAAALKGEAATGHPFTVTKIINIADQLVKASLEREEIAKAKEIAIQEERLAKRNAEATARATQIAMDIASEVDNANSRHTLLNRVQHYLDSNFSGESITLKEADVRELLRLAAL